MQKAHANPNICLFLSLAIFNVEVLVMTKETKGRSNGQTPFTYDNTLPRNDLLSRLYWGTQWTMEIS